MPYYWSVYPAGNRFAFAKVLQKFLHGLKSSLDGDLSNHAVVVGMNKGAKSICDGLRARYSHHCVLSSSWSAHEPEEEVVSQFKSSHCTFSADHLANHKREHDLTL